MNDSKIIDQSEQLKTMSQLKDENSNNKQRETSLMPGLGYMTTGEERFRGRRNVVFDSDSEYVKLAKRGGLPDLLTFGDMSLKPTLASFRKPEWLTSESSLQGNDQTFQKNFSHSMSQDTVQDEYETRNNNPSPIEAADRYLHEKQENQEESEYLKSGTPDSRRQRDGNTPSQLQTETMMLGTETNPQMMLSAMSVNRATNRFTRRKEPPVSMQKLLSFGYADDWFSGRKDVKTTKEQNMGSGGGDAEQTSNIEEHSVAAKDDSLLEGNLPTYRGKRTTGIRGSGKNKATPENDSFFKIFGEHRLKDLPGNVENRLQSEIALA